jgi:type IV pilus assembly protein PilN
MVKINLLPIREILRKRELKQFGLLAAIIFAVTIVIMIGAFLIFSFKVSDLEALQKQRQSRLASLKEKNKEIEELRNKITRLQKQVETIKQLTQKRDTPAPFMQALCLAIPDEVWVQSVVKAGKHFTLDGTGVDNTVVVNFVHNLQRIRDNFSEKEPYVSDGPEKNKTFFNDVRLVQIAIAQGAGPGLNTMSFKIVGNLR